MDIILYPIPYIDILYFIGYNKYYAEVDDTFRINVSDGSATLPASTMDTSNKTAESFCTAGAT
jgi:hypothetical protein